MKNLNELAGKIRFDNASKGFDPGEDIERHLLLVISEICEAQDELRSGKLYTEIDYSKVMVPGTMTGYMIEAEKPEGFPVEIADAIIRILDIQAKFDMPIRLYNDPFNGELNKELLRVVNVISDCVRIDVVKTHHMNVALTKLFKICEFYKINIMKVIDEKLEFNRLRPAKHGRQF